MAKISHLPLLALLMFGTSLGFADVLKIPVGSQGDAETAIEAPQRGMSMESVRQRWGEPKAISPTVGEPPITSWEYPEFKVYFERNLVLHAVLRDHGTPAAATDSH